MLKDGYKSYLQSHPELTQLLGDLVSSLVQWTKGAGIDRQTIKPASLAFANS